MYYKILLSCFLLIFFSACPKDNPTVIVDVEDDFYIQMFEDISGGGRQFYINITTIKEQTCLNYEIDYDLNFNEQLNNIELIINDLVEPTDCETGTGTATVSIPFGTLSEKLYTLDINLKNAVINKGTLGVYSDRYELDTDSDDGIEVVQDILYRIPANTIWGYVAYQSEEEEYANNFISNLNDHTSTFDIANNLLYKEGDYGYFRLDNQKFLSFPEQINAANYQTFIYQYDGEDLTDIEAIKNEACGETNANLSIMVFTHDGRVLECN